MGNYNVIRGPLASFFRVSLNKKLGDSLISTRYEEKGDRRTIKNPFTSNSIAFMLTNTVVHQKG